MIACTSFVFIVMPDIILSDSDELIYIIHKKNFMTGVTIIFK